ncbi:hypothetical protein [Azotobacter chroococcum]|uniref:Uncharacterized protein n=1 Tax=Azotobacter chroococcum TaxID=353 RepID=A0AAP9YFB2_9GAMM|nr:hypothetical protein GKQ51_05925 [Azotobacter chroococcum]
MVCECMEPGQNVSLLARRSGIPLAQALSGRPPVGGQ